MVSTQPIYLSDFKVKQQSTPETYSGTNDIKVFNNWLRSILHHYQLTKMCCPDYDELHTTQMGQYLKDTAATWFRHTVESIYQEKNWNFEDTVCELFKRFV